MMIRILVMYDLPSVTTKQKLIANKFRQNVVSQGFLMLTESIYTRCMRSSKNSAILLKNLKKRAPKEGNVHWLVLPEKIFEKMVYITGTKSNNILIQSMRYIEIE